MGREGSGEEASLGVTQVGATTNQTGRLEILGFAGAAISEVAASATRSNRDTKLVGSAADCLLCSAQGSCDLGQKGATRYQIAQGRFITGTPGERFVDLIHCACRTEKLTRGSPLIFPKWGLLVKVGNGAESGHRSASVPNDGATALQRTNLAVSSRDPSTGGVPHL